MSNQKKLGERKRQLLRQFDLLEEQIKQELNERHAGVRKVLEKLDEARGCVNTLDANDDGGGNGPLPD